MTTTNDPPDRVLEAAMDWLLRVEAAPGDLSLRRQLDVWCASDPAHAAAWVQARQTWGLVAEVPPVHVADWPAVRAPRRAPAARVRSWRFGTAGLALAACLMLLFVPMLMGMRGDHATSVAEIRQIVLEDGSRVVLGPRSALDVRFAGAERRVILQEGEAFFEVASDPRRPFVVTAAGVDVAVVGTAFDVRIGRRAVVVAVQEGIVELQSDVSRPDAGLRLGAGDRVKVDLASRRAERGRIAPLEVASWREGRMFVDGATVSEVAEELRRYRSGWIVVGDSRLAAQRVTGLFELDDTDRALAALVEPFAGRVHGVTSFFTVLTSP